MDGNLLVINLRLLRQITTLLFVSLWTADAFCHLKGDGGAIIKPATSSLCKGFPWYFCVQQRFVSSIGNIEKAMWVFNCLGRSGWFGQSEIILRTDINLTTKDPWQSSNWYSKNYPNQKKFGSFVFKPKKECRF